MRKSFPTNPELTEATIQALKSLGGQGTVTEINEKIIEILNLPEEVVNLEDESGLGTKLNYTNRWIRTKLKSDGIIESVTRGTWKLK